MFQSFGKCIVKYLIRFCFKKKEKKRSFPHTIKYLSAPAQKFCETCRTALLPPCPPPTSPRLKFRPFRFLLPLSGRVAAKLRPPTPFGSSAGGHSRMFENGRAHTKVWRGGNLGERARDASFDPKPGFFLLRHTKLVKLLQR